MARIKDFQRFWSVNCPTEFTSTRGADALQLAILKKVTRIRAQVGKTRPLVDAQTIAAVPNYLGHRVDTFA